MINIGVIGYGYWGPNIVRNFSALDGAVVQSICDSNTQSLDRARKTHPQIYTTQDCCEVLNAPNIDAVAVITPVSTHIELAKEALLNGKHVFVEKPFTATVAQAEELIDAGGEKEAHHHGRPYVHLHRRREKDQAAYRRKGPGRPLLLRFRQGEPGAVPARCERDLGPGAPRLCRHGLPYR